MTLSSTVGPSGGGNSLTGTVATSATNTGPFTDLTKPPTVQFQWFGTSTAATCSKFAQTDKEIATATGGALTAGVLTVDDTDVKRISNSKIAFTVPSGSPVSPTPGTTNANGLALVTTPAANAQSAAKYNVCVYDSNSTTASNLLATATYTIAPRPTITSTSVGSAPTFGGQPISINGTGFSATANATTVSIGGTALINTKVNSTTNITGTIPAHAAATGLAIVVNTVGGSVSSLDADNDGTADTTGIPMGGAATVPAGSFAYTNGIIIGPNTVAPKGVVNIDVTGVGFQSLNFVVGAAPSATGGKSHVLLINGAYLPNATAGNYGVEECLGVFVIGDKELICTLNLNDSKGVAPLTGVANTTDAGVGTYTVTVVADGDPAKATATAAGASIISSGSTFTIAPY